MCPMTFYAVAIAKPASADGAPRVQRSNSSSQRGLTYHVFEPLIQAPSLGGSGNRRGLVDGGIDPQRELAGELFARLDAVLRTRFKKNLERNPSFALQSFDILRVEVRPAIKPNKFTSKHLNFRIESNHSLVAVNGHRILGTHG